MQIKIEFNIDQEDWNPVLEQYQNDLHLAVEKVLKAHPNYSHLLEVELSVLLTNSAEIQKLNTEFRNKNKPTNILSFPDQEILPDMVLETIVEGDYIYLGDMALCYEVIRDEALRKEISFHDHLMHLFVHGVLHLIGYNHTQDEEADAMETIEISILSEFGIKSPY